MLKFIDIEVPAPQDWRQRWEAFLVTVLMEAVLSLDSSIPADEDIEQPENVTRVAK